MPIRIYAHSTYKWESVRECLLKLCLHYIWYGRGSLYWHYIYLQYPIKWLIIYIDFVLSRFPLHHSLATTGQFWGVPFTVIPISRNNYSVTVFPLTPDLDAPMVTTRTFVTDLGDKIWSSNHEYAKQDSVFMLVMARQALSQTPAIQWFKETGILHHRWPVQD